MELPSCRPSDEKGEVLMWYTFLRVKLAALLHDERGDLSTYLAQGILALAALSLTGVVMVAFTGAGTKLTDIVNQWLNVPISS